MAEGFDAGLYAAKIAVHGTIGGITSVLQGGKFGHGFASAGLTAAATTFNNSRYIHKNSNGFSWRRVALGAAIGGSASKVKWTPLVGQRGSVFKVGSDIVIMLPVRAV